MKQILTVIFAGALLAACNAGQMAKFQAATAQVRMVVAEVNTTIASVSAELADNCAGTASMLSGLDSVTKPGSKWDAAFDAANAVVRQYCQTPPANITQAVAVTGQAYERARAAYQAARAGG